MHRFEINYIPDTGNLAMLNCKNLPETSEKASEDSYGEDKVTHLGEIFENGEPPLVSKVVYHMNGPI